MSPPVPNAVCLRSEEMAWNTPVLVEIALGAEINCYACAEL